MALIRINQTKITLLGDKIRGEEYIGVAESQMHTLIRDMSFQSLSQSIRRVRLFGDVFIKCIKVFNYQECQIYIPLEVEKKIAVGSLVIMVSTQSGDEAFVWDIAADEVLVELMSREEVLEQLVELEVTEPVLMLPSGYVESSETIPNPTEPPHRWVWQPPMEIPEAFVANVYWPVAGEAFRPYPWSEDFGYSSGASPLELHIETKYPFVTNPYDVENTRGAYLLQWYAVAAPIWYEYILGHYIFDPEISDQILDPALTYPTNVAQFINLLANATWNTLGTDPDYRAFLSSGVTAVDNGAAVFDFFSVCDGWDFVGDTGFSGSYASNLNLFVRQTEVLVAEALQCANLVNEYRVSLGLEELIVNLNLVEAAERHALDCSTYPGSFLEHIGSDGSTPESRMVDAGYTNNVGQVIAITVLENIAYTPTAAAAFAGWKASPSHHAAMVDETVDEMGFAVVFREIDGYGNYVWVQTFGNRPHLWPGFGPVKIGLKTYLDANFTFAGTGDETHVPLFYLAQKKEEEI